MAAYTINSSYTESIYLLELVVVTAPSITLLISSVQVLHLELDTGKTAVQALDVSGSERGCRFDNG